MANLSADERKAIINDLEARLQRKEVSIGEAVKVIRVELYRLTQTQYARFAKVSDKTLRDIEKGNTDPRLSVVQKLLRPGGFDVSARKFERVI